MLTAMEVLAEVLEFPTSSNQESDSNDRRPRHPFWESLDATFSIPLLSVSSWAVLRLR